MPYIIVRMTDHTETLINTATKKTATEFKEGCSYFGLIGENKNNNEVYVVAFTITKIKSHYIYIKNCVAIDDANFTTRTFFQDYKTTKKEHFNKHTINTSFGKVEASNCYEFNDINVILTFISNWECRYCSDDYEEYKLTNTTLNHYYNDTEKDITILDF